VAKKMRDLGNLSRHSRGFLGFVFTGFEKSSTVAVYLFEQGGLKRWHGIHVFMVGGCIVEGKGLLLPSA